MDHVQISLEEYNKLRDFYVSQDLSREDLVCVESWDHNLRWARKKDLDGVLLSKLELCERDYDYVREQRDNIRKHRDKMDALIDKIPMWIRKIFKAV